MIGINVTGVNEAIVRVTSGNIYADLYVQEVSLKVRKKGAEIVKDNIRRYVYEVDSSYADRRTGDLLRSVRESRFMMNGGQVYISRQTLKRTFYAPLVNSGFTHVGGKRFAGRHFWEPSLVELRALLDREKLKAARLTALAMTRGI
jgi:hypothetical protein